MNYRVECEWPLNQLDMAPAIDVTWFTEENQAFPIMSFEIETRASTGMVNNAVKVFSRPNEELEKPLFYFHIVISASTENERIDSLRRLFGNHNYRVYILNKGQMTEVARDILAQHRRIRATIDLPAILKQFTSETWDAADLDTILDAAERLQFRVRYLQAYAERSSSCAVARQHFISFLRAKLLDSELVTSQELEYDTPLYGAAWVYPIHLGILATAVASDADRCFALLRYWQNESSYMSQIGPHWGLSRDYDEFIAGASASLWGLLAALFRGVPEALEFIAQQMVTVFSQLKGTRTGVRLFHAVWLLHVSAAASAITIFNEVREFIGRHASAQLLICPPAYIDLDESDTWWSSRQGQGIELTVDNIRNAVSTNSSGQSYASPADIAMALLIGSEPAGWESRIISGIWRNVV